ncbi:MAG: acetyl esterase/lipase [Lentimonas sp.]|jgi:acetyl esterase/lipase
MHAFQKNYPRPRLKSALLTLVTSAGLTHLNYASFTFTNLSADKLVHAESWSTQTWGSPIWVDLNGDDYLDLIVPNHTASPRTYINDGAAGTLNQLPSSPRAFVKRDDDTGDWHGFSAIDFDNDGDKDVFITQGAQQGIATKSDLLYLNDGTGNFTDGVETIGAFNTTGRGRVGAWFDYDNDGFLDLFLKTYESEANLVYRNDGNGGLEDISSDESFAAFTEIDQGSIMQVADFNRDGLTDIFITGMGTQFSDKMLFQDANGTFTNVTDSVGISVASGSRGIACADYDNDGDMDLLVLRGFDDTVGKTSNNVANILYQNDGTGNFIDVTDSAGIQTGNINTWSGAWADLNNDGWLDLVIANPGIADIGDENSSSKDDDTVTDNLNFYFMNAGDGTFTDVSDSAQPFNQLNNIDYRHLGLAAGDYDNDGDLDLIFKNGLGRHAGKLELYSNDGNSNNYLICSLVGTASNRDGIGAEIVVETFSTTQTQQNYMGNGGTLYSQSAMPLHFGLGADTSATIAVTWPNNTYQTLEAVTSNQRITITQPVLDFSVDNYSISKVPQQNQYIFTLTGSGLTNVITFTAETNPVIRQSTIEYVRVSDNQLEIYFKTDPTQTLDAAIDGYLSNTDGATLRLRDSIELQTSEFAVELPDGVTGFENIVYANIDDVDLMINLYRAEASTSDSLPVVLWIHGGAFQGGNRRGVSDRVLHMTTLGYAVVSMDHRLIPDYIFDAPIEDTKAVVRFLRANADTYGLDPDRIGAIGGSSGGFLAALLGTSGEFAAFEDEPLHGNKEYSSAVSAVIVLYGGTDIVSLTAQRGLDGTSAEASLLGADPITEPELYNELAIYASPSTYVSANDPAFLLVYGTQDTTAPPAQGILLQGLLNEVGVYAHYSEYPYGHSFPTDTPELNTEIYDFFEQYLKNPALELPILRLDTFDTIGIPDDGTTVEVTLTGAGFSAEDAISFEPLDEIVVQSQTFVSSSEWRLTLVANAASQYASASVTLYNPNLDVSVERQNAVQVVSTVTPLTVTAISPTELRRGQTTVVTVTGTGFTENTTIAPSGSARGARYDNEDSKTVSEGGTVLTLEVTLSTQASTGMRSIIVTEGESSVEPSRIFTVTEGWYDTINWGDLDSELRERSDDPDKDGLANLMEAALGTNPSEPTRNQYPLLAIYQLDENGKEFELRYPKPNDWMEIKIQHSTDLINWTEAGVSEEVIDPADSSYKLRTLTLSPDTYNRRFFRLSVDL